MTRRRSLTRTQRSDIFDAAGRTCHICNEPIDPVKEPWQADHVIPRGLTGSDAIEEYKPAHERCHGHKTKRDVKDIAKASRVRARERGVKKPSRFPKPPPGYVYDWSKARYVRQ